MTWDADSNRITFTSSQGGTYTFVYDVTAGIPAVIEEVAPGGSVYYIREPNGALIARVAGASAHYYHFEALGSTRLLTDDDGAVTDTYTYDAWGNTTHETGTTAQPYQYVGQLSYYTHVQDGNMSLLQLGVRLYDPETGRFTQVDPPLNGLNFYAYVADQPLTYVDPTGLRPWWCYSMQPWWWWLFPACQNQPMPPAQPPMEPIVPPPADSGQTLYKPKPLPSCTSVPPYMLPPGIDGMVTLLDPCAARDVICTKWIKDLEDKYMELCAGDKYMERPDDCEKLAQFIEDVKTWCQ